MHCLLLKYEVYLIRFGLIYNAVYKPFRNKLNKLQGNPLGILCAAIQSTHFLILFILYGLYILIDRRAGVNCTLSEGSELCWVH
jgi:hypothetical protein